MSGSYYLKGGPHLIQPDPPTATIRPRLPCSIDEFDECDREFAEQEGDWATISYKRIRVCGFLRDNNVTKAAYSGGASVPAQSLRFFFKLSDIPNIRCDMPFWLKDCRYLVGSDPLPWNGWHYVTLKDCGECA